MSNQLQLVQATEQDEIINEVCDLASKLASAFHEPPCYWTAAMLRKCYQQSYLAFSEAQRSPREQRRRWWVIHYADMALYALCCRAEGSFEELEDFQDVTRPSIAPMGTASPSGRPRMPLLLAIRSTCAAPCPRAKTFGGPC